jgi:methylmalonyl-CoA mutase C-terminal domain/subunit
MPRKIRVLVGKPGLDGHDRGAKVVAAALRDAGMEVIYTGLHQSPEQVVEAAMQEDVDVVALSILSGAHMTLFPDVLELMKQRGIGDRLLTGGGIIPPEDMQALQHSGVGKLFGPGSSTQDIVHYIREWFAERHGRDALMPLPPAPPMREAATYPEVPRAAGPRPARAAAPASPGSGMKKKSARPKPATKAAKKSARRPVKKAAAKRGKPAARARKPAAPARRKPAKKSAKRAARSASPRSAPRRGKR